MEKKGSPKKENQSELKSQRFIPKIFGMVKFILGLCLLPSVYSTTVSFLNEFALIEKPLQNYLWAGVITFLAIYLFFWEPTIIYLKGQRLLEIIFSFFKPLVRVAPYLLPVYSIILFFIYEILSSIFKSKGLINYFIFLFGFSLGLHLVFSAKTIRSKQQYFLKANYIFGFSLVYITNLILVAFCLNLIFKEFSLVNFFNNSFQIAKSIFSAVFKQFFL